MESLLEGVSDEDLFAWLAPALDLLADDLNGPGSPGPDFLQPQLSPQLWPGDTPWGFGPTTPDGGQSGEALASDVFPAPEPTFPQPSPSSKPRRKRAPTSQQQMAELERQIEEQTAALQNLSMKNVWLSERVRILELVIAVKESQFTRVQAIQGGLSFNPFECMGITVEDVMRQDPSFITTKIVQIISGIASQITLLLPHLQRHPWLMWGPRPNTCWAAHSAAYQRAAPMPEPWQTSCPRCSASAPSLAAEATAPARFSHGTISVGPPGLQPGTVTHYHPPATTTTHRHSPPTAAMNHHPPPTAGTITHLHHHSLPPSVAQGSAASGPDPSVLEDIQSLVTHTEQLKICSLYAMWLRPMMLMASSVHWHAIDPAADHQWEEVVSSVRARHEQRSAAGLAAGSVPPLAPPAHWKSVVCSLMLSDQQKLQASVLCDIITTAVNSVVAQRAALGAAMAKLQQQPPQQQQGQQQGQQQQQPPQQHQGQQQGQQQQGQQQQGQQGLSQQECLSGRPQGFQEMMASAAGPPGKDQAGHSGGLAPSASSAGDDQLRAAAWKGPEVLQQEAAILKQLQLSLVKERCLVTLSSEALFHGILTPVQVALNLVSSYPYIPDHVAILHAAAAEFTPQVLRSMPTTADA